ncbi:MAG TPA: transposase [Spirochaetota bacterium]|nr:transposase [Spirochaetota bacterium]
MWSLEEAMAWYKPYSYEQGVMIPVDFTSQIVPGTIEYTINWLIDNKIELSGISKRFINDRTGAPAYDPAILLKILLPAYSLGIISSRMIMKACRENIIFKALTAGSTPDFTTISAFIRAIFPGRKRNLNPQ